MNGAREHEGTAVKLDAINRVLDQAERALLSALYLHRANPDGTKNDKLPRSGDVLREALRVFGGELWPSSSGLIILSRTSRTMRTVSDATEICLSSVN